MSTTPYISDISHWYLLHTTPVIVVIDIYTHYISDSSHWYLLHTTSVIVVIDVYYTLRQW